MVNRLNRLFILAAAVLLFFAGYGVAAIPRLGMDAADDTKARALALHSEVRTLDRRLERRTRDLDAGLLQARADGRNSRIRHLKERQELIQRKLMGADGLQGYRERIAEADGHVLNDRFEKAIQTLSIVRVDLYRTLDDIAAAEYLVDLVPRVEALRDTWREKNNESGSSRTAETEAGYQQAVEQFEAGDLSDALWTYRQLASDYETLIAEAG